MDRLDRGVIIGLLVYITITIINNDKETAIQHKEPIEVCDD